MKTKIYSLDIQPFLQSQCVTFDTIVSAAISLRGLNLSEQKSDYVLLLS